MRKNRILNAIAVSTMLACLLSGAAIPDSSGIAQVIEIWIFAGCIGWWTLFTIANNFWRE